MVRTPWIDHSASTGRPGCRPTVVGVGIVDPVGLGGVVEAGGAGAYGRERAPAVRVEQAPGDLIKRAHDAGILWIQQVMDVRQAEQAVGAGADVIVALRRTAGTYTRSTPS
ncbi:NAD(P)H-dependent flavin oxidoreductase YrpB (nitropropane dioxygenase family) [Streptomyces africanus]|uniref:NAD(P)H-dependent flavin oxidoreductase YrpB (Nitropropane dioxygenase family) n=1 Tax=Streptomyces africanus TaxID=231024 RepID=A0ABU0QH47_9ACTN|nr:NAD(P)H-dependent flavin oxidoreductase YrpB (nitropropane dioxygenase family) [Streptomyces africanus]